MTVTRWVDHVAKWKGCELCRLCETRTQVVLGRGKMPCDVLFIGESPGDSEDALGIPFVPGAPAGRLLAHIVANAVPEGVRVAFTNLVGCIPLDGGSKREPDDEEIRSCRPRLEEAIKLFRPRLVISVGKPATEWMEQGMRDSIRLPDGVKQASIAHPAGILRLPVVQQGLAIQRAIVTVENAVEDHVVDKDPARFVPEGRLF